MLSFHKSLLHRYCTSRHITALRAFAARLSISRFHLAAWKAFVYTFLWHIALPFESCAVFYMGY